MHSLATDRNQLRRIVDGTLSALHAHDPSDLMAAVATATASPVAEIETQRDAVINALENSARTIRLHNDLVLMTARPAAGPAREGPFIPEDQVLSLVQSAIDEFMPEETRVTAAPFDPTDPGWISVVWEKLKALFRGKHKFITHTSPASFHRHLPDQATVVLFSDWGTGEETAKRVMRQIALQSPTHAIHLGDVYYSGTERESRTGFSR